MAERTVDYSQLTQIDPSQRRGQSFRMGMQFTNEQFVRLVKVLTAPDPIGVYDSNAWNLAQAGQDFDKSTIRSFAFMGRIMDNDVNWSPHRLISDPYNTFYFDNACQVRQAIKLHTIFEAAGGWDGEIPSVGDIVKVQLQPGSYSVNVEKAYFDKILVDSDYGTSPLWGEISGEDAFANGIIDGTVGSTSRRSGGRKPKVNKIEDLTDSQIPGAILPVGTGITSGWGIRIHPRTGKRKYHAGVDFGGGKRSDAVHKAEDPVAMWKVATKPEDQQPCVAVLKGEVIQVTKLMKTGPCAPRSLKKECNGYGTKVTIKSNVKDKGGKDRVIYHVYAHLETINVKKGPIEQGTVVGNIGAQGGSTGPHLHFEARVDGNNYHKSTKDPFDVFGWSFAAAESMEEKMDLAAVPSGAVLDYPEENLPESETATPEEEAELKAYGLEPTSETEESN